MNLNICKIADEVIFQKFTKGPDEFRECLRITKGSIIAEAAIKDSIWGIGMYYNDPKIGIPSEWNGSNILGWALMKTRIKLFSL